MHLRSRLATTTHAPYCTTVRLSVGEARGSETLGWGGEMRPREVEPIPGFKADVISAGYVSTCAVRAGALYCWGYNDDGSLGVGSMGPRYTPTRLPLSNVEEVSVGSSAHSCAIADPNHSVYCWGNNYGGQMLDQTTNDAYAPVPIRGVSGVARVAAGPLSTCAVLLTGEALCWGFNGDAGLADGTVQDRPEPVTPLLDEPLSFRGGGGHWCALLRFGQVACWGQNGNHEIGDTDDIVGFPFVEPGIDDAVAVSPGGLFSCALRGGGRVSCWGDNSLGELGTGTVLPSSRPVDVVFP